MLTAVVHLLNSLLWITSFVFRFASCTASCCSVTMILLVCSSDASIKFAYSHGWVLMALSFMIITLEGGILMQAFVAVLLNAFWVSCLSVVADVCRITRFYGRTDRVTYANANSQRFCIYGCRKYACAWFILVTSFVMSAAAHVFHYADPFCCCSNAETSSHHRIFWPATLLPWFFDCSLLSNQSDNSEML